MHLHHQSASELSPFFPYAMHGPSNRGEEQEYPHPLETSALIGERECISAQWVIGHMLLAHDCVMQDRHLCTHSHSVAIKRNYVFDSFSVLTLVSHAFPRAYHT